MTENTTVLSPGLADIPPASAVTTGVLGISGDHKEFRAAIEALGQHIADTEHVLAVLVERAVSNGVFTATGSLPGEALQRWLGWDKNPAEQLAQVAELLGARHGSRPWLAHPHGQTPTRIHRTTMGQLQQSPQTKPTTGGLHPPLHHQINTARLLVSGPHLVTAGLGHAVMPSCRHAVMPEQPARSGGKIRR